ncbi:hypothetical protein TNCV_471581 [Trichonephila clavipes]|nr:hypothetical protein TNCV_471581 [Trichonephila clavipes]
MDDLRVVYVKVKGEQEMVNAVIDTGAQMPVVRPDVVEGQSINNRGVNSNNVCIWEHEMGERLDSPRWALAFSRSPFQTSLLPAGVLQFLILKTSRSFSRPSIHLRFSLPFLRVPIGWSLKTF